MEINREGEGGRLSQLLKRVWPWPHAAQESSTCPACHQVVGTDALYCPACASPRKGGWRKLQKRHVAQERAHAHLESMQMRRLEAALAKLNSPVILGRGFALDQHDVVEDLIIHNDHRNSHVWVWGTTRSGKSRLAEALIEQDIRAGRSVVVFDPKGDGDLFNKVVEVAEAQQRLEDLMLVTPIFPELSAIIDPLASYYMPEELISHIISGVPMQGGDAEFFYNTALTVSRAVVQSLIAQAKSEERPPTFNLREVEQYITYDGMAKLRDTLRQLDQTPEVEEALESVNSLLKKPPDYYSKVVTGLEVALSELTAGSIGRIIGKADENRFLKRMDEGRGVILVVQLGSMLTHRAAFTSGKVILSMLQSFIGRKLASNEKVWPPLCVHIDEAHNVINPSFATLISMCGGADVKLHCYNQTISQLYDAVGEDLANAIVDNANTKVFLRVPDPLTAKFISEHLGEKKVWSPMMATEGNITIRETEDVRIKPSEVMNLSPREFFLLTYSGAYRGKTLDVQRARLQVDFPVPTTVRKSSPS